MSLVTGTNLGRYEIRTQLGAGGMGEVYLAQDTKLDRKVALKILPADVASNRDRMDRFVREAKSAAALNHPNIAHIYEIGESDGTHYIAMEFIDGETLRYKIHRDKAPLPKLLKYLTQVAQGLSKAHAAGIVHRDLKPDNIMITRDDYAKVLDFGLAKLVEPQRTFGSNESGSSEIATAVMQQPGLPVGQSTWDSGHSTPGMVMGTIGYMSPEQASGRVDEIDLRSDIFSFGCILFEAATGQRAFAGKDVLDSLHKIVHAPTPQLKDANPLAPAELQRIVRRCLAKEREKRYQSIKELAIELDDLQQELKAFTESEYSGQSTPATSVSTSGMTRGGEGFWIAVLPFKVRDADPAVEILADGLSEEIVTGLSRFRYLSVVTSTSAVRLNGEIGNERALGAKLGTRYVLEGSIRKGGSAIRVSVQLVDTETGAQLWSETYNRDLHTSTIFAVQDDVAGRIVATVADSYGVLVHSMRAAIRKKDDADLTPVEWQFQYFAYREQITPSAHAALKGRLERVAKRNDRQSDLWACLAQIYVDEYAFGFESDATSLDRALAAGRRGVELDRANQFALVALAQVHFFRQDLAAFGPAAERAMALNPLNTDAIGILGLQIVHTGEFERGTAVVRRAMELNPNHAGWMHFAPLWDHFHKGEYEQALECANRVDVPGLFWPYLVMASACGHLGRRSEAEAAVKDLLALDPEFAAHARSNVGTWHFASGLMDPILEGLRKAGLSIPATDGSSDSPRRNGTVTAEANRAEPGVDSAPLSASRSVEIRSDEGFWVTVLPFKSSGTSPEVIALAEGLSEELVTGLSRFSYLRVVARSSTLRYASSTSDVRTVGKELGARYVIEGSLRQAGPKLRLAVQLVDATTGAHLWAENYERTFSPEAVFELQDDLVPRIVSTVADWYGVLPHSMSEAVRFKPPEQLSPYEALLRSFGYFERIAPEEHAIVRSGLERAVAQEPGNADGWAMLSMIFGEEHRFGFNVEPDSLGRSLEAARRAVEIAHANHFAWLALAQALFFRKEFDPFRDAAERAIALNPMDGSTVEYLAHLIAFSGNWERGCELAERARQLNPNHPSWYWSVPFLDAYRKGDYVSARPFLMKGNPQKNYLMHALLAAVHGQLGESEAAARHLREVLTMMPDFHLIGRGEFAKWYLPELVDQLMDGLCKAGLEIGDEELASTSSTQSLASSEARAEEGFWVAVLPFKFTGSNTEVATLAEGLSEQIVTGLSRFSYLRVISRGSTLRYASATDDVRAVGKTLGARYVMEGTLRLAGSMLRVAVQLVDASTGAHLWAETYDRPFHAEDIFALQDDLVPCIVSTVADQYGALVHSMSESLRGRSAGQYSAHEAVLRAFGYCERMTPKEHAEVRDILEAAVAGAPDHSDCLAELAMIYWHEYAFGYNLGPDPLGRARATAQRAVASAPTSHLAHCALATGLFFQKDYLAFRPAAERALALNRMDSSTAAILGNMIAYAGDWESGLGIAERAMQLNPHHAGWYRYVAFCDAYRKRDYRAALASALKVNMPGYYWPHVYLAAVYGQLGEHQRARAALRELNALVPNFGAVAREEFGKWLDAELTEHLLEGLRKAGLEIVDEELTSTSSSTRMVSSESRVADGFWIAVLPFKFTGTQELAALAEGLSEEISTGLSRFSYLRVIARSSTLRYASETSDVRTVGQELTARYVMEGSLRQVGPMLRVSVQLVDSTTGAHLWAETYNRQFRAEEIFTLQDDLVPRIVSTVADINGVLPRSMSEAVCSRSPDELTPYEAVLRSFRYFDRVTPEELTSARSCLEIAVEKAPTYADAWAMLALLCVQDYAQGFNLRPDSLTRGTMAAQRAVEAAPSNHLAHFSLAQARFFQKELQSFRNAAERAVALNPMDGNSLAFIGELLTYVGDEERGLALATRAKEINPNHPGWFWYADFFHAYRHGDYRGALDLILKTNLPGHWGMHAGIAAAAGQLGNLEAAGKAIRDLLKLRPDFCTTVPNELSKWFDRELREHLIDGLCKAGLEIVGEEPAVHHVSSEIRADEGFWIAVLPFKVVGPSTELETLALGMTEEIVTGFSRFSYLKVRALGSTKKYSQSGDLRRIGAELGARYVMEGSIRQAGSTLRLAVQLVDASDGAHLWAETFDRNFQPDQVFAMQDELIPRIVSTCADHFGVLARSISDAIRGKEPSKLTPYEALMRGFGYHYRLNPQEHAEARDILEEAVKEAPNNADCWAMLSWVYSHEYGHGFNTQPGSLDRALAAARRAVDLAPTNHLAYQTLAVALFFRKERANCLSAAERALALNPLDASNEAIFLITFVDDWERGCSLIRRAMDLNPYVPGWYRVILALNEYRKGNYREAVDETVKANAPGIWTDIVLSAAYAQLGEQAAARNALSNLLAENSAESARELLRKWFDAALVDNLVEGLRKGGLEIAADKSTTSSAANSESTS